MFFIKATYKKPCTRPTCVQLNHPIKIARSNPPPPTNFESRQISAFRPNSRRRPPPPPVASRHPSPGAATRTRTGIQTVHPPDRTPQPCIPRASPTCTTFQPPGSPSYIARDISSIADPAPFLARAAAQSGWRASVARWDCSGSAVCTGWKARLARRGSAGSAARAGSERALRCFAAVLRRGPARGRLVVRGETSRIEWLGERRGLRLCEGGLPIRAVKGIEGTRMGLEVWALREHLPFPCMRTRRRSRRAGRVPPCIGSALTWNRNLLRVHSRPDTPLGSRSSAEECLRLG